MLISEILARSSSQAPLIVLVHGRAGNVKVMQAFKPIFPTDVTVVSVQAPLPDPEGGFRWWDFKAALEFSEDAHSGAGHAANLLIDWLDSFIEQEALDPKCICALGFSQGAALLSYVIQINPKRFKAVALLAGFVVRSTDNAENTFDAGARTRVFMAHGTKDEIVPVSIAAKGAENLKAMGFEVDFLEEAVGHKIGVESMKALKVWLSTAVH